MTSFKHLGYPSLVEFPLEEVVNHFGRGYFNGTGAYAVAYAIFKGATKISLFGCDFTYPDAHKAEKGRACMEFWLGYAAAKGIEMALPYNTSLMDAHEDQDETDIPSYGYDAVKISCERDEVGRMSSPSRRATACPPPKRLKAHMTTGSTRWPAPRERIEPCPEV
jgi:hypothetical protein